MASAGQQSLDNQISSIFNISNKKNNMCIICVDYNKGNLTIREAKRNFLEMVETLDSEHAQEVADFLHEQEIEETLMLESKD